MSAVGEQKTTVTSFAPKENSTVNPPIRRISRVASVLSIMLGLALAVAVALPTVALAIDYEPPHPPLEIQSFTVHTTNSLGEEDTVAGGHPFKNFTQFDFPTFDRGGSNTVPSGFLKDAGVTAAPGFLGNPATATRCPFSLIINADPDCPPDSKVGFATIAPDRGTDASSLYNVKPDYGFPAEFVFNGGNQNQKVVLYTILHPRSEGYGLTVGAINNTRVDLGNGGSLVTGFASSFCSYASEVPGNHVCLDPSSVSGAAPFLSNSSDCADAEPTWKLALDSWENAGLLFPTGLPDLNDPEWKTATTTTPPVVGCDDPALAGMFDPTLSVQPQQGGGAVQADQPSGLAVDFDFPQNNDPTDPNTTFDPSLPQAPQPKEITTVLPAGLSISPSSASGLQGCSDLASDPAGDQVHYDTTKPVTCPDASKIGTAVATSPTLATHDPVTDAVNGAEPINGSVYLLKPHPGDLPVGGGSQDGKFRLLIELENERYGINIKLPGIAVADKSTGQLSATFTENPQLPAKHLTVSLKSGPRAPLASPTTCGSYTTTSDLTAWSTPGTPNAHPSSTFSVSSGPGGSACPASAAARPFAPGLSAGMDSNAAGKYSPFVLHINRADGEQELSTIDVTTPKGFSAKLAGVPYCSESAIAAAAAKSGAAEQASPSCPAASQIGSVTAGAGPGASPFYASGKAYLAGPYKGAPLSFAFITPALAGPFDLGTVVVRAAAYVDPETAQVTTKTDPLPQMLDGVPLRLRSITARFDRANFTINPTNCSGLSVGATVGSTSGTTATPSNPFQVAGCKKLGFKPGLKLSLKGGTKRGDHPALKAVLSYPSGSYANIAGAVVGLPHSEFLAQDHIKTICTRAQFTAGAGNGAQCPRGSIYGFATATTPLLDQPLSGPVFLRSSSHKLPDLVAALNGQIDIALVGRIDSKNGGIRTTFESVPDAPVSRFVLSMQGGKKGLLENSGNLCRAVNKADALFTAQNGLTSGLHPVLSSTCKKKAGKGKRDQNRH